MCTNTPQYNNVQSWCMRHIDEKRNFYHSRFDDPRFYINCIVWVHPPFTNHDITMVCKLFAKRKMRGYLCVPDWSRIWDTLMKPIHQMKRECVNQYHFKKASITSDLFNDMNVCYKYRKFGIVIYFIDCRNVIDSSQGISLPV